MDVEEALKELLPTRVLVQLIEQNAGRLRGKLVETDRRGDRTRARQYLRAVVFVVPVQVDIGATAARSGLAHLAWPTHERHLAILRKVFLDEGII